MWHVSEGDLHAYLDGALDLLPSQEADRIREHLGRCLACASRLEEESRLRAEASTILDQATPGEIVLPPLEDLRRRADAGRAGDQAAVTGGIPRRVAWAWAATVVLALGIGWGVGGYGPGRGGFRGAPGSSGAELDALAEAPSGGVTSDASAPPPPSAEPVETGERELASSPPVVADAAQAARRADDDVAGEAARPGAQARSSSAFSDEARDRVAARDVPAAPPASAETETSNRAERAVAARPTTVTEQAARAASPAPPSAASAEAGRAAPDPGGPEVAAGVRRESTGEPTASLVVPGLAVDEVHLTEKAGEPAVRVLQRLADGTPVEVLYWGVRPEGTGAAPAPAGADPSTDARGQARLREPAAAQEDRADLAAGARAAGLADSLGVEPLPAGWAQVIVPFRGGWAIVRGPVSEDALRRLAAGLR